MRTLTDIIAAACKHHGDAYQPAIDTQLVLHELLQLFEQHSVYNRHLHALTVRIDHIMKELDDLTAAVKSVTGGTDGIGAIIAQQRDTIAARDAKIKDLEAALAAGSPPPPPVITGIDPAALVPLTAELNADADKLVAVMMPPV